MSALHGEHTIVAEQAWAAGDVGGQTITFDDDALPVTVSGDSDGGGSLYLVTLFRTTDYSIIHARWGLNVQRHDNTASVYFIKGLLLEATVSLENPQHVSGSTFSFDVVAHSGGTAFVVVSRMLTQWPLHT